MELSKSYNLVVVKPSLSKEWHPTKNGKLTPKDVTPGLNKSVWWICKEGHEWEAIINNRSNGRGCPYCSGRIASVSNCLQNIIPSLSKEWHPTKNKYLTPKDVTPGSGKKVWWKCEKGHEWKAVIAKRSNGRGCPYCGGKRVNKDNCLQTINPSLSKEWHPTKNGKLTPKDVTPGSGKKVWWKCKKGHEWQAVIASRSSNIGCPYCSGKRVNKDNCLQTINPKLAKEWHPTKNDSLTPKDVTPGSEKKVWWKCKKGHKWQAIVGNRNKGVGCPYCSGKRVNKDNCLQTINPKLAKEWHPTKNGSLTPKDVTPGSGKKVWWKCKKGHEWEVTIGKRNSGEGCPFCSGHRVNKDNSLQTINPKLSKEWHPTKNDSLTPKDVTPGSGKKVWWKCEKGHEWKTIIYSRSRGQGCPFCHSQTSVMELRLFSEMKFLFKNVKHRVKLYGKECDIYIPDYKIAVEYDGSYWHVDKFIKDKEKTQFLLNKGILVIRIREKGLKKISKHDIIYSLDTNHFVLIEELLNLILVKRKLDLKHKKKIKLYSKNKTISNEKEYIKLLELLPSPLPEESLFKTNKSLSKEWHPTKNGSLTPKDVTPGSEKKVWWKCKKGHKWQAIVGNRNKGVGCPYCSGNKINKDNCLQTINPKLSKEWHLTKNGNLTPYDVTSGSGKKVWWQCKNEHEWQAVIAKRNSGRGCPYCSNQKVNKYNCLQTINPKLSKEWHPTKNSKLTPKDVLPNTHIQAWWRCKNGHEWEAIVGNRNKGRGCPYCSGRRVNKDNCLQTINPKLSKEWHPTKNGNLTTKDVTYGSNKKVWWICKEGHEWISTINNRSSGYGCPHCYREGR